MSQMILDEQLEDPELIKALQWITVDIITQLRPSTIIKDDAIPVERVTRRLAGKRYVAHATARIWDHLREKGFDVLIGYEQPFEELDKTIIEEQMERQRVETAKLLEKMSEANRRRPMN